MHLAYVPLIRREASTCKESSHTSESWTFRELCNMTDETFLAATACVCGQLQNVPRRLRRSRCVVPDQAAEWTAGRVRQIVQHCLQQQFVPYMHAMQAWQSSLAQQASQPCTRSEVCVASACAHKVSVWHARIARESTALKLLAECPQRLVLGLYISSNFSQAQGDLVVTVPSYGTFPQRHENDQPAQSHCQSGGHSVLWVVNISSVVHDSSAISAGSITAPKRYRCHSSCWRYPLACGQVT